MTLFELSKSPRARWRAFARAQLPLLTGTFFVSIEGAWALPDVVVSTPAVVGVALIVISSVLFAALPWEKWPTWSLIPLAVIDVVGVAYLRLAYFNDLPSVGILTVFPVLWLAYSFRRWTIALAIMGAFFITLLPSIVSDAWATTPHAVVSVLTLPVVVIGLAVAVSEAARQLAGSERRTREANRQLERSLRRVRDSEALTRTLFDTVDVAIAFYDTNHRLIMANPQAIQAGTVAGFQIDKEPFAGPEVRRSNRSDPIPFDEQIIPRALRGDLENHEVEWIGPPGQQIAIAAFSAEVAHADGTPWGTLIAAYDVTDLARSLRVKDEFITTVSHELRTPLTSIVGYLEVLTDELEDADPLIISSLAASTRNAHRLQARIEELLDTADQRRQLNIQRHDLATVIDRVIGAHTLRAKTANTTISTNTPRPLWGSFDAERIEQVLENLLSNAIKYAPAGQVAITGTSTDSDLIIEVKDNGIGMSPDEISQAFDMFWRADRTKRDATQGIGIGLSLARRLVEAHHGTIHISSTENKGTTFTIVLPMTNKPTLI
ncbi:PAS domain-containing sensor histidine kinase [Glaciihabitans sp. dw_435]|uniref:sensor histidine kinase n=1 Tax=Glaciihabitans sp. dw_435 TaxID=2720081 RepID=UPI001BD5C6A3|nr:PAS domain-containing sensor histidine kinase [Glaciihabitans sp. dw_435]